MRKKDIQIGGTYLKKVSGKVVAVKITSESHLGGWNAINTKTGRQIRVRSARSLRGPKDQKPQKKGEDVTINFSPMEKKLIGMMDKITEITSVQRRSKSEFDMTIHGTAKMDSGTEILFQGYLPLMAIRSLIKWESSDVASMSDHPEMVEAGDWSGIRDSSKDAIWRIFWKYVYNGILIVPTPAKKEEPWPVGQRIVGVRQMTKKEFDHLFYGFGGPGVNGYPVVFVLSDGSIMMPMADPEGNGPGHVTIKRKDGQYSDLYIG